MDATRAALENEIAALQGQVAHSPATDTWADQCEQALLATALLLHRNLLEEAAAERHAPSEQDS